MLVRSNLFGLVSTECPVVGKTPAAHQGIKSPAAVKEIFFFQRGSVPFGLTVIQSLWSPRFS